MSAPHLANLWTRYDLTQGILRSAYLAGGINFVYDQTLLPDSPVSSRQTYALVNAMAGYAWVWNDFHLDADIPERISLMNTIGRRKARGAGPGKFY